MKNNILYRFLSALLFLSAFSACSLREIYDLNESENFSERIEFVARPVGFNNQSVETKAKVPGDVESKIYSCYLLIFDNAPKSTEDTTPKGNLLYCSGNLIPEGTSATSIPAQKLPISKTDYKSLKVCFIVNVPESLIHDDKGSPIINNITKLNNAVLGPDHFNYADYSTTDPMGVPEVIIYEKKTPCIPAYGEKDIDLANGATGQVQIPIKRLFAKVVVDIKLVLSSGSQVGDNLQNWLKYTSFKLMSYELKNLPSKVKLVESGNQSSWVKDKDSDSFATSSDHVLVLGGLNQSITNNESTTFYLYVPEYYLTALDSDGYKKQNADVATDTYGKQEYKPLMFETGKKPIYITILGQYSPYMFNKFNLTYDIYLGENATSSFTLKRNTCYTNTITITGANNSKDGSGTSIDHRVNSVTINDITIEKGESANCYIYTTSGKYSFPTYMGAYTSLNEAKKNMCVGGVNVIKKAQSNISNLTPVEITDLTYSDNEISFNLSTGTGGNVVLELQDADGDAIWSWHLWVSPIDDNTIGIGDHTYPNGAIMMNRNLGAFLTKPTGTYYRYGHKEPFIDNGYKGGDVHGDNTWDPTEDTNSESSIKAVNDPCPPGYKIPSTDVWGDFQFTGSHAASLGYLFYNYDDWDATNDIYYPYSGRMEGSQLVDEIPTTTASTTENSGYAYEREGERISKVQYDFSTWFPKYTITTAYRKYVQPTYSIRTKVDYFGAMLTKSGHVFQYQYNELNVPLNPTQWGDVILISSSKYCNGVQTKKVGRLETTVYETSLSFDDEQSGWSDDNYLTESSIDLSFMELDLAAYLARNNMMFFTSYNDTSTDTTNGFQVRCVSYESPIQ